MKEMVPKLSRDERLDLVHLLMHLELQDDPAHLAEMERRMTAMDAGKKVTQEEVERRHRELMAQGR